MANPKLRFKSFTNAWNDRKISDICNEITDFVAAGSFEDLRSNVKYLKDDGYAQLVRTKDLKNNFTSEDPVFISEDAYNYLWRVKLDRDAIVLPNVGNCGESYYISPNMLPRQHNALGPNAILVRTEDCDTYFLSLVFKTSAGQEKLKKITSPSGQSKFNKTELKNLYLSIPSINEQQKIAEFFTAFDEKIRSIENKLSLIDRTKKYFVNSLLQKKFRFVKDNGSAYTDWVSCNVANIADVIGGGTPSTTDETYWNGDINWFTPAEISSKYLIPSKRKISKLGLDNSSAKLLPKNSLLLTTRASLGLCSINSLDSFVCTNQGFQSLICKENAYHEFVYYMVTSDAFKKELKTKASGSTFLEVSSASLKSIKIEIPCYEEQIKIADFISQMDQKMELLVKQKKVFENMKKAFMQRMFV